MVDKNPLLLILRLSTFLSHFILFVEMLNKTKLPSVCSINNINLHKKKEIEKYLNNLLKRPTFIFSAQPNPHHNPFWNVNHSTPKAATGVLKGGLL